MAELSPQRSVRRGLLYRLARWYARQWDLAEQSRRVRVRQHDVSRTGPYRVINVWPGDQMDVYGDFTVNGIHYQQDRETWAR
jgi:hypothetical protein